MALGYAGCNYIFEFVVGLQSIATMMFLQHIDTFGLLSSFFEPVSKRFSLSKVKDGANFNSRNSARISRIKICAGRIDWSNWDVLKFALQSPLTIRSDGRPHIGAPASNTASKAMPA